MRTTATSTTATTEHAVTSTSRMVGEAERRDHKIITWYHDDASYTVEVRDAEGVSLRNFAGDNRGRVEREAETWIDAQGAANVAPAPVPVGGWRFELADDRGGAYQVLVLDDADGSARPDAAEFRGYRSREQALEDAAAWATEFPLRVSGESPPCWWRVTRFEDDVAGVDLGEHDSPLWRFEVDYPLPFCKRGLFAGTIRYPTARAAVDAARSWCARFQPDAAELPSEEANPASTEDAPPQFIHDPADEPEESFEDAVQAASPPAPAAPSASARPLPWSEPPRIDHDTVDEVWTLLQQREDMAEELALLRVRKKRIAGEEKELVEAINEKDLEIRNARHRTVGQQRTLPLNPAPRAPAQAMTLPQVVVAAEKATQEIQGPEVPWAFNGVDHVLVIREHKPDGKAALGWRCYLKGHEDLTEAFDLDRSAVIESCKARASIVFADAEPGSTAIPTPPRKGRGRKAKTTEEQPPPADESPDAPRVIEALRLSSTDEEAATKLGRTVRTVRTWCAENGVTISEHLGRDLGHDGPAPPPAGGKGKKASKRGGRRAK